MTNLARLAVALFALSIFAAACGGGNDDAADGGPRIADEQGDGGTGTGRVVNGPYVSLSASGLGLYALDRDTGDATELSVEGAGFTDRLREPVVAPDGTAYAIVYNEVEGQTITFTVGLASVDPATGTGTIIAGFGQNRDDDEDMEGTSVSVAALTANTVWVEEHAANRQDFLIELDAVTGVERRRFALDEATNLTSFLGSGDSIYAIVNGSIAKLDVSSGTLTPVPSFSNGLPRLGSYLTAQQLRDFAVSEAGAAPTAEDADSILRLKGPRLNGRWVEGDGSLWWMFDNITTIADGSRVNIGGVAQYDIAADEIVNLWPFPSELAARLEQTGVGVLGQPELFFLDGQLWVVDDFRTRNGKFHRLDPVTGDFASFGVDAAGAEYATLQLVTTDPAALWLKVTRWTSTSSTSSRGETSYVHIDAESGAPLVSTTSAEIFRR